MYYASQNLCANRKEPSPLEKIDRKGRKNAEIISCLRISMALFDALFLCDLGILCGLQVYCKFFSTRLDGFHIQDPENRVQQFLWAKRLGNIRIDAGNVQSQDPVNALRFGGDDNDRNVF